MNPSKKALLSFLSSAFPALVLIFLLALPLLPSQFKLNFAKKDNSEQDFTGNSPAKRGSSTKASETSQGILNEINPAQGYETRAVFGNLGPQLLESGAIDLEKFKEIYAKGGQSLNEEELRILTTNTSQKIKITPANAHFLLNFFWALGLVNKNPILEQGPMTSYGGGDKIGNFASTGGWTLGSKKATDLYSKVEVVKLNSDQQKVLESFAYNSFRPCCSNPTAFPDCNHGMAALGLGEVLASQGASLKEIFNAFKYFNSFWFPQTYLDIAKYFQVKEGKNWSAVDGAVVASKDYSTPQGWQRIRGWLKDNNLLEQPPEGGGGCGI